MYIIAFINRQFYPWNYHSTKINKESMNEWNRISQCLDGNVSILSLQEKLETKLRYDAGVPSFSDEEIEGQASRKVSIYR